MTLFHQSLVVALSIVFWPLKPTGAVCSSGLNYSAILRDFTYNTKDACRSEHDTISFVRRRTPHVCSSGLNYDSTCQDYSDDIQSVSRSEEETFRFVEEHATYSCCAFDLTACENAKATYDYFSNEKYGNPSDSSACYYNFFIMFYSLCHCPSKIKHTPTTRSPIRLPTTRSPIRLPSTRSPIRFPSTRSPIRLPPTTIPTDGLSCGLSGLNTARVFGGETSLPCEFPWMARLIVGEFLCGGVLVDSNHVLTAGHCAKLGMHNQMRINLNTVDTRHAGLKVGIKSSIIHPKYKVTRYAYYYDIAILTLAENVPVTKCIQPICLPIGIHNISDTENCYIAGWGENASGKTQRFLQKVKIPLMSAEICKRYVEGYKPGLLCGGYLKGVKDACAGDSGGPLMCHAKGQWVLVGLVSFGFKCAKPYHPGVYTDIKYHLDWILENLH